MKKKKITLVALICLSLTTSVFAMPSGGTVAGGTATVTGVGTGTLTSGAEINVGAGSALINWDSFGVAGGEKLFYDVAKGGLALNYVTGSQISEIMGALTAKSAASTGTLMLVNPNGVLVGSNAVINIPNLVLSSMDLENANAFINDPTGTKLKLKATGKNISVEKNGSWTTPQIKSNNLQMYAECINLADSVYLVATKFDKINTNSAELAYDAANGIKASVINDFAADALPTGGTVVTGDADISTPGTVKVNGNSIINWDSFDIGRTATMDFNFSKGDSIVLNRVTGNTLSHLYGTMKSSGSYWGSRVLLLNPNGILVGNNAVISGPALTLSTLDMKDSDFDNLVAGNDVTFFTNTSYAKDGKGSVTMEDGDSSSADSGHLVPRRDGTYRFVGEVYGKVGGTTVDIYGSDVNIGKDAVVAPGVDTNIIAADSIVVSKSNKPVDFTSYTFGDVENIYLASTDGWHGIGVVHPGGGCAGLDGSGYDVKEVNASSTNKIIIDENAAINNIMYKDSWTDGDVVIAGGAIELKKDASIEGLTNLNSSEINILAGNKITFTKDDVTDEYVTTIKADTSNTIHMDSAVITNLGSDINVMGGSVTLKDTVLDNKTVSEIAAIDGLVGAGDVTVVAANDIEKMTVGGTVGHGYKTSKDGKITRIYGPIDEMVVDYEKKKITTPMVKVYRDGELIDTIYDTYGFADTKGVILDKHTPKENTGTLKVTATAKESLNIVNSEILSSNDAVLVGASITKDAASKITAEGGTVNEQVLIKPTEPPATEPPAAEPPAAEPPATEPPATEPPATEPPAAEPPATEPPATEPPATEPPATEPPATEPPAAEPPAAEPPATEPPATEPPATEPPATEPPATEPPATEPPATEPPAAEPPAAEPPAAEPPAAEPPATEPPATEPPATEPPATEPPAAEPPAAEPPTTERPDSGDDTGSVVIGGTTSGSVIENWQNRDDIIRIEREISNSLNAVPSSFYTVENLKTLITVVQDGAGKGTPMKDIVKSCMAVAQSQGLSEKHKANLVVAFELLDKEFATANTTVKKQVVADTVAFLDHLLQVRLHAAK